jgi:hypothetical protein
MIEFTPAELQKAKQLRQLLESAEGKPVHERIVQKLMGKFRAPFVEVEKAIRMAVVIPSKLSPLTLLNDQAFHNGRCVLSFPGEQQKTQGRASTPSSAFGVQGYEQASMWFHEIGSIEARNIMSQIARRLKELGQPQAADDPLLYGSGQTLLVWWHDYCHDAKKQAFYQACARGEIHTPESLKEQFLSTKEQAKRKQELKHHAAHEYAPPAEAVSA